MVDKAYAAGLVVIFTFHDIVASGGTSYAWTVANFNALVDYIAAKGDVPVLPMGEALAAL
ncbi:hypothetical protein [Rhodococcus sp. P1Y]|uniref:hypothetical protein n=1 Tax=Rhodococcus sp. P1Y TaxID=1302308 RepID=UPI000EAC3335|nr:hypothetical protein [Rhodococcus sp. P1Y]AYJ48108.1 hypothetical protein D8W71_06905 [Rhodococcus sp. P1Y]